MRKVFEISSTFRSAMELIPVTQWGGSWCSFPSGCCGDTTLLLASYLDVVGYKNIYYCCGTRGEYSHAWAQLDNIVIDITGDQFIEDRRPKIYVDLMDNFYRQFEIEDGDYHYYRNSLDGNSIETDRLSDYYIEIRKKLIQITR